MVNKRLISYLLILLATPVMVILGTFFLPGKYAIAIAILSAVLACAAFAFTFERGHRPVAKMVLISVMVALSVIGRMIFAFLPGFKPVAALVILTGIYFGEEAGFLTGSLTALLSNIYFGQGAWTPFQMLTWGVIGFFAGLLAKRMKENWVLLIVYGLLAGVVYSLLMDTFSELWVDGTLEMAKLVTLVFASLPVMAVYAVSNAVFLAVLKKPFARKAERIIKKYGI